MKKQNKKPAIVYHTDLYGKRQQKYDFLNNNTVSSINWNNLDYKEPYFFFVPKDFELEDKYMTGFKVDNLLKYYVSGFQTKRDKITINFNVLELDKIKKCFVNKDVEEIKTELQLPVDGRDWKIEWAKKDLINNHPKETKVMYRPFDERYTFYTGKSKGFVAYPRTEMLKHLNKKQNISLLTCRQQSSFDFQHIFVSRLISDMCNISSQTKETGYIFPLYLYPNQETEGVFAQEGLSAKGRKPNLNMKIVDKISKKIGLKFIPEIDDAMISKNNADGNGNSIGAGNSVRAARELPLRKLQSQYFAPINILDYIYAVLHSPNYRKKYKEFLKIDFPRVPYPKNKKIFWQLVALGGELRKIHLLESPKLNEFITSYPIDGTNKITTKITKKDWEINISENNNPSQSTDRSRPVHSGRIYINETQYFNNIPLVAWEFYIGGYQPAQKWLKDRTAKKGKEGRTLTYEDIIHYQKIIVALTETDRIMKEIDKIEIE